MLEKDLTIFDYRKEKEKMNTNYIINERVNGRFSKHSFRTKEAGYIDCYFYRPNISQEETLPIIINLHGGGFVLGYCEQDGLYCQRLADACNCCVINIDYCLAPEFKFPAAIYSTYDVIRQIKGLGDHFNLDTQNISIIGHSAGGNIACSLALLSNSRGDLSFKKIVLNYPLLDFEEFIKAQQLNQITPQNKRLIEYSNWYLLSSKDAISALASPLNGDLSNLPETFMLAAELDPLYGKELEFYHKSIESGSTVHFKTYHGCGHGFTHKWFEEFDALMSEKAWKDIYNFFQNKKLQGEFYK